MLVYFASCIFFLVIAPTNSQDCPCDNPNTAGGNWTSDLRPVGACTGECNNGKMTMYRLCSYLSDGRTNTIPCTFASNCTNEATCEGSWTSWSYVGRCSNTTCMTNQLRNCYMVDPITSQQYRTVQCAGSNGKEEESRMVPCRSRQRCKTTTPTTTTPATTTTPTTTTTRPTTPTTTTARPTTTISTASSSATTISTIETANITQSSQSEITFTRSSFTSSNGDEVTTTSYSPIITTTAVSLIDIIATTTTSSGSQIPVLSSSTAELTLPLVLCSVAVICVAVIISFVIIFKRRPPDHMQHSVLVSSNTKDNNNDDEEKKVSHNYEVVGPALPPSRKSRANTETKNEDLSLSVPNVLYSKEGNDASASLKCATTSTMEDEYDDPDYLTPLNTAAPKEQKKAPASQLRPGPKQLITLNGVHGNSITENSAPLKPMQKKNRSSPKMQNVLPTKAPIHQEDLQEPAKHLAAQNGQIRALSAEVRSESAHLQRFQEKLQGLAETSVTQNDHIRALSAEIQSKPVENSITLDEIPKPKDFTSDKDSAGYSDLNEILLRQNQNSIPKKETPVEGDYVKDISRLMKPKFPPKKNSNTQLSDLGYVTIEQLKSRNLI